MANWSKNVIFWAKLEADLRHRWVAYDRLCHKSQNDISFSFVSFNDISPLDSLYIIIVGSP